MDENPKRRWFRFRLSTVLVLIAIVAWGMALGPVYIRDHKSVARDRREPKPAGAEYGYCREGDLIYYAVPIAYWNRAHGWPAVALVGLLGWKIVQAANPRFIRRMNSIDLIPNRLLRWGLRTWLVGMAVLGVGLGWWSQSALRQSSAVKRLEALNVVVVYDWEFGPDGSKVSPVPTWLLNSLGRDCFHSVFEIYQHSQSAQASARTIVDDLEAFPKLRVLTFSVNPNVTDADLHAIGRMPELEVLRLWNSRAITPKGLLHLRGMNHLRQLDFSGFTVNADGVVALSGVSGLTELRLTRATLDQDMLTEVGKLTHLTVLEIDGPRVPGDVDLRHFVSLVNLKRLSLPECRLSSDGLAKLQKALPDCTIALGFGSKVR